MSWPLPLARDALRQAAKNPVPQPMPTAAKRAAEEAKLPVGLQGPVRPRSVANLVNGTQMQSVAILLRDATA